MQKIIGPNSDVLKNELSVIIYTAISNIISEIISLKKKFETSKNIETIQEIQENVQKWEDAMNKKANKQEMN
ncbi:hypothetical protein C2G38_2160363 [Gigaspora rosea]|uniref:Uncharacterized protein n=1 Tax=Gigaspora rosea TaxID=44941 RepID=A0A397VYB1_9GLOM|nr:hypothetical protein C2G38_2160363 [Gigaspora rosea]